MRSASSPRLAKTTMTELGAMSAPAGGPDRPTESNGRLDPGREPGPAAEPEPEPAAPSLPVQEIGDVALADLLGGSGCPLCRLRADASGRYLDALLWEGVNDPGFRGRLAAGRGFCPTHAHGVLDADRAQTGGSLGAAILLAAAVRHRLVELRGVAAERSGRRRAALAAAAGPAACPVCEQVARARRAAISRLLARLDDPAWRATVAQAAFCLDDLLSLWAAADRRPSAGWSEVLEAQLERIADLVARLDAFAHHSSYDRRHLLTNGERSAPDDAALLLGGTATARGRG